MDPADTPPEAPAEVETRGRTEPTRHRGPRFMLERGFVRLVATVGIVGIDVGIGAILGSRKTQGWIVGLVVAIVTIVLTALLSRARLLRRER